MKKKNTCSTNPKNTPPCSNDREMRKNNKGEDCCYLKKKNATKNKSTKPEFNSNNTPTKQIASLTHVEIIRVLMTPKEKQFLEDVERIRSAAAAPKKKKKEKEEAEEKEAKKKKKEKEEAEEQEAKKKKKEKEEAEEKEAKKKKKEKEEAEEQEADKFDISSVKSIHTHLKTQDTSLQKIPKRNIDRLYQLGNLGSQIYFNDKLRDDKKIEYIGTILSLMYSLQKKEASDVMYNKIKTKTKSQENFVNFGKDVLYLFVNMFVDYERDKPNVYYNMSKAHLIFKRLDTDKMEISHLDYDKKLIISVKVSRKSSLFSINKAMLLHYLCGKQTDTVTQLMNNEKEQWRIFKIGDKCFDFKTIIDTMETYFNNKVPQFPKNNTTHRKWTQLQLFEINKYYETHSYSKLVVDIFLKHPDLWIFDENWERKFVSKLSINHIIWDDTLKKWKKN